MSGAWRLVRHPDALAVLQRRAAALAALRGQLAADDFLEADVPVLSPAATQDAHLSSPRVDVDGFDAPLFLQTSPELALKRLVCAGAPKVYALGPAFRGGREELSRHHQPAFAMLEWYRPEHDLEALCDDVLRWEGAVARGLGVDVRRPCRTLSVHDAFLRWADLSLDPLLDGRAADFADAATRAGIPGCAGDDPVQLFSRVLVERIEPALHREPGWTFLTHYPACVASLAALDPDDERLALRAEAYLDGVEIANGYAELADVAEHRRRWAEEARARGTTLPLDEDFLADLEAPGLPDCSGMALGVDRLVMALLGDASIADVLPLRLDWTL